MKTRYVVQRTRSIEVVVDGPTPDISTDPQAYPGTLDVKDMAHTIEHLARANGQEYGDEMVTLKMEQA